MTMLRGHRFPGFTKVPYTPGCDFVGVVDQVGDGVEGLEPGRRVAASTGLGNGGHAEFVCLSGCRSIAALGWRWRPVRLALVGLAQDDEMECERDG